MHVAVASTHTGGTKKGRSRGVVRLCARGAKRVWDVKNVLLNLPERLIDESVLKKSCIINNDGGSQDVELLLCFAF